MFEEVLECAGGVEEKEQFAEDHDTDISDCSGVKDKMDPDVEDKNESKSLDSTGDELTFPESGILSPLSKSVEAAVTPLVRTLEELFRKFTKELIL